MSRLGEFKRKRDKAELELEAAEYSSIMGETREAKQQGIDAARAALEKVRTTVRYWEANETWGVAESQCGPDNVAACATFAAGLVQAHAIERAAEIAAKESERAQTKQIEVDDMRSEAAAARAARAAADEK